MVNIPASLRQQVGERARHCCEYCRAPQIILLELELDHIQPTSAGGATTLENLCLACPSCNGFKSNRESGSDPMTGQEAPLFNPRTHIWADHFMWSDDHLQLIGLTSTGRTTIMQLRINRPEQIEARGYWILAGVYPPPD